MGKTNCPREHTLLIVDDAPESLELTFELLEKSAFDGHIMTVSDGEELIHYLTKKGADT